MKYLAIENIGVHASVKYSAFEPQAGVREYHAVIEATDPAETAAEQIEAVDTALQTLIGRLPQGTVPVFKRYMLSDPTNQAPMIGGERTCAVSMIGQAPLRGVKIALWVYLQTDMQVSHHHSGLWAARHGGYTHLWAGGASAPDLHSELATMALFGDYVIQLDNAHCTLMDNCLRTWFFVRDIDVNYRGVVAGRNDVFRRSGLTALTHFIASTGIAGVNPDPRATVTMDAYAVGNIDPKQVTYLKAADFLNSTMEYGVAFERGTAISYGDRRHVLISGTASINNKGEVMYPGDIRRQSDRMLQNVEALVREGGCEMTDLTHIIVYLRDPADYQVVEGIFDERFPDTPWVIVHAPVCRPGWLIEVECMAIKAATDPACRPL